MRTQASDDGAERPFDKYASDYQAAVESSVTIGQDLAFFTSAKIYQLRRLARDEGLSLDKCSVLDVGCGPGLTDELLGPYVGDLTGVDVSPQMIEAARARNPSFTYEAYDGQVLPFPDERFTFTFAICVLHHVAPDAWNAFLSEMLRVTRLGGVVAVIEHNPLNPLTRLSVMKCVFDDDAVLMGPRRVIDGLRAAGAQGTQRRYVLFVPFGGDRVRAIEHRSLSWCPLGAQYVASGVRV